MRTELASVPESTRLELQARSNSACTLPLAGVKTSVLSVSHISDSRATFWGKGDDLLDDQTSIPWKAGCRSVQLRRRFSRPCCQEAPCAESYIWSLTGFRCWRQPGRRSAKNLIKLLAAQGLRNSPRKARTGASRKKRSWFCADWERMESKAAA